MIDGSRFWHFLSWLRFYSPPSRQASHYSVQLWALMQPAFPPSLASWVLAALPLASSALLLPTGFSPTSLFMRSRSGGENAESADQTFYVYTFPHVLLTSFSDASPMKRFQILLCRFFPQRKSPFIFGDFYYCRCSSSHNGLRGIHSTPSPIHSDILLQSPIKPYSLFQMVS